jgi:hypothetical protein
VSSYLPILVYFSNDDSANENPPLSANLPLNECIENELAPTPSLPRWVCSTGEATSDIFSDLSYHR